MPFFLSYSLIIFSAGPGFMDMLPQLLHPGDGHFEELFSLTDNRTERFVSLFLFPAGPGFVDMLLLLLLHAVGGHCGQSPGCGTCTSCGAPRRGPKR